MAPHFHSFQWVEEAAAAEARAKTELANDGDGAKSLRRAGHCYYQAAYQSGSPVEFQGRMERALSSFRSGAKAAADVGNDNSRPLNLYFEGLAHCCEAQLAENESVVLLRLYDSLDKLTAAWKAAGQEALALMPTLPYELLHLTNNLMDHDPELERRLPRLKTALSIIESPDKILEPLDNNLRSLFLTELVELLGHAWTHLSDNDERESAGQRALQLFETLRKEVANADDPRCAVAAFALQLESSDLLPAHPPVVEVETLSPNVEASRDKVAIGTFLATTLRARLDPLRDAEDPGQAKRLLALSEQDASRASIELQTFPGIRRVRESAGYVYWSKADTLAMYARYYSGSRQERERLTKEAVEVSYQIRDRSPPKGIAYEYSNLGYYIYDRSLLERDLVQRRRSLEEAWRAAVGYQAETHLFFPHWYFGDADHFSLFGRIKREQARTSALDATKALSESVEMFQKAVNYVEQVVGSSLAGDPTVKQRWLGQVQYELGSTQLELYRTTRGPQLLEEALSNLHQSAEAASRQAIPTRAGEALARIGDAYLFAGSFEEARSAFLEAAQRYHDASSKYPGLATAFNSRVLLLNARAATATAQGARLREAHKTAAQHYREAYGLLTKSPGFQVLASLYEGWALLADAEALSQTGPEDAARTLQAAIAQFVESEKTLRKDSTTEPISEAPTTEAQLRLLKLGRQYAEARLTLEEARELERKGELVNSMDNLEKAARQFEALSKLSEDPETEDLMRNQGRICRATAAMLQAELNLSPELYAKAASLFHEVQQNSRTKPPAAVAGGWSACCKALELGLRYRESTEKTHFQAMKKQLASANAYFVEAGSTATTSWLMGTGCMFDAVAHLTEAEASLDPSERRERYEQAEKQLRLAAEMFEKAGYPARQKDALRYLHSTTEQRHMITTRLIQDAPVSQSVSGLAGRAMTGELLVNDELLAPPPLHAALSGPEGSLYTGQDARVVLTLLNPGRSPLVLVRVEGLDHADMEVQSEASEYPRVNGSLEMLGKRLAPLAVRELPLRVRTRHAGKYTLQLRILFTNPRGELQVHAVPAVAMTFVEVGLRSWLRGPKH